MKQPNTKLHWTALAVARYYDRFGTACRGRDLYPYVRDIHDKPDDLISALAALKDVLGNISVKSPIRSGGSTVAFAYYPTSVTIEELRDIGEPTELPDGSPVPEDANTTIPSARVADDEEVPPPTDNDTMGLQYENMVSVRDRPRGDHREYDTSNLEDIDVALAVPSDGDSDDDETPYACEYCGESFPSSHAKGGHKRHCIDRIHTDALHDKALEEYDAHMEDDLPPVDAPEETPDTGDDPIGDIDPEPPSLPMAGEHSNDVDWHRVATRLERKAVDAHDAGLTEVASAYSQFAALAVEGSLEKRMAFILLGTPILEIEDTARLRGGV